jgi:hypothetical protein
MQLIARPRSNYGPRGRSCVQHRSRTLASSTHSQARSNWSRTLSTGGMSYGKLPSGACGLIRSLRVSKLKNRHDTESDLPADYLRLWRPTESPGRCASQFCALACIAGRRTDPVRGAELWDGRGRSSAVVSPWLVKASYPAADLDPGAQAQFVEASGTMPRPPHRVRTRSSPCRSSSCLRAVRPGGAAPRRGLVRPAADGMKPGRKT